jgi:hypothetical protein
LGDLPSFRDMSESCGGLREDYTVTLPQPTALGHLTTPQALIALNDGVIMIIIIILTVLSTCLNFLSLFIQSL